MQTKFYRIFSLLILLALTGQSFAQSDLQIFGFFQGSLNKLDGEGKAIATLPAIMGGTQMVLNNKQDNYLSAQNQQLNLFLRKEINENFTTWVNLEIVGSYNSKNSWGSLSLEEAWVNYQTSNYFNVKAGLLIPRFAYLNEIKNRMPLLPYITRPLVYEASLSGTIDLTNYTPDKAFLQVYGYIPAGDITLDYAAFVGNAESSYIANSATGGLGTDTTTFKLLGGRVGMKYDELRIGVSATLDKDNQQANLKEDVQRTRVAFDFGYAAFNFFLDAEYIYVKLDPKNTTSNLDKYFYYTTLGYNISDNLFVFGSYSKIKDNGDEVLGAGMFGFTGGIGYKPVESVVLKAGYSNYGADASFTQEIMPGLPPANVNVNFDYKIYNCAISVLF